MSRRLDTTSWLLRSRSGGAGSSSSNMAAQNAAGAAGSSNDVVDLSAQTQIILGVVIGSVVLIAITAGLLFFLTKKKRWDQIRHREEQLLALQAPTGYNKPKPFGALASHRLFRKPSNPDSPPAYRGLTLPPYDPASYSDSRPLSTAEIFPDGVSGLARPAPIRLGGAAARPLSANYQQLAHPHPRDSTFHLRSYSAAASCTRPFAGETGLVADPGNSTLAVGGRTATAGPAAHRQSISLSSNPDGLPPLKKPKPVLSKLITTF